MPPSRYFIASMTFAIFLRISMMCDRYVDYFSCYSLGLEALVPVEKGELKPGGARAGPEAEDA